MKIHHVDSKQTMLSVEDILMVSAHDHKDAAQKYYKQVGSPEGVSPERVMYTIWVKNMSQPQVIRLREGNSLFPIVPLNEHTQMGMLMMFDADVPKNTVRNGTEALNAARKMGFKTLLIGAKQPEIATMAKLAFSRAKQPGDTFEKVGNKITVRFANVR